MIKIAPSILAADPLNLGQEVSRMREAGCDWIHVDVMDAHFVPNLAYSPEVVRHLSREAGVPLDVHLMMDQPETLLDAFLDAGASSLTIHAEIRGNVPEMLKRIRERGRTAGVALRPGTPISRAEEYLDLADLVLTMTVEPGFGGQELERGVIAKMRQLREMGYKGEIEADGGIREDNLKELADAGLTVAVMGTALFGAEDAGGMIRRLHRISGSMA